MKNNIDKNIIINILISKGESLDKFDYYFEIIKHGPKTMAEISIQLIYNHSIKERFKNNKSAYSNYIKDLSADEDTSELESIDVNSFYRASNIYGKFNVEDLEKLLLRV